MMDRIPVVKIPVRSGCSLTLPVFLTESGKGFHHRGQVMSLNTQKKPVIPEHPGPTGFVSLKESSHCYVEVSIGNLLRLLDRFRQFRQEVEDVRFDAHVRHLKYGGFGILVNGDDKGTPLDSTQVLERAADAACQVNLGFDGLTRSPDLARFLKPFGIHDGTGAGYGSAHGVR